MEKRNEFSLYFQRLIVHIAKTFMDRGVDPDDLYMAGNAPLLRSLESFNPHIGVQPTTYFYQRIKRDMQRLVDKGTVIHRSEDANIKKRQVLRAYASFYKEHGYYPDIKTIAASHGLTDSELSDLLTPIMVRSLGQTHHAQNRGDTNSAGPCPDSKTPDPSNALCLEWVPILYQSLTCLSPLEREVVDSTFGLGGHEAETMVTLGKRLGKTSERIRQIREKALGKLRNSSEGKQLEIFVEDLPARAGKKPGKRPWFRTSC